MLSRPSVFAVFVCPLTNEVLLVRQRNGKWSLPGGRCDRGESLMGALRREVFEETGWLLPPDAAPVQKRRIRRPWRAPGCDAVVCVFRERPPVVPASEVIAAGWFAPHALPPVLARTVVSAVRLLKVGAVAVA